MTRRLSIAMANFNAHVGDVDGNCARMAEMWAQAAGARAPDGGLIDLVVFPELALLGYPCEDLVRKGAVQKACADTLDKLAELTADGGPAIVVGAPVTAEGALRNAAVLLADGRVAHQALKGELPNYGPFDEPRIFTPHGAPAPVMFEGFSLGLCVCEDIWLAPVGAALRDQGAQILIAPHASPFRRGALALRHAAARERARATGLPVIVANLLGGQDELVFDAAGFAVDASGEVVAQLPRFEEGLWASVWGGEEGAPLRLLAGPGAAEAVDETAEEAAVYRGLVLGLRDYVRKSGFSDVLLGLSGGLDSALVAAIAVDALGPDHVRAVRLPSRYSSDHSMHDAQAAAKALGITLDTLPIQDPVDAAEAALAPLFEGRAPDVTEENIQSRMRGLLLMALSNKTGALLLSTGNKSENAVGYATLYGDMCGAFNPLKDVYKTEAYRLARLRNAGRPAGAFGPEGVVIPEAILTKAPSAELRPDQKDTDSLPDYDRLDVILHALIEEDMTAGEAAAAHGFDAALVTRVEAMVYASEYKRRQSAPGTKVSPRMFGKDRRYPIVNAFRG